MMRCTQAEKFVPGVKQSCATSALVGNVLRQVFRRRAISRQSQRPDAHLWEELDQLFMKFLCHILLPVLKVLPLSHLRRKGTALQDE